MVDMADLPPAEPMPCPKCSCMPTLIIERVTSHYECKKWFGFKTCFIGPEVLEGWSDREDYVKRVAARAWNRAVEAFLKGDKDADR